MNFKSAKRAYKRVKKFFRIERFLCCFEIESSVSLVSIFTAVPCCLHTYHDAAFLWNYVSERNEEEVRGVRWLDGEGSFYFAIKISSIFFFSFSTFFCVFSL